VPAPRPRSALALDLGRRRIGLAGCDALGLTVTPLPPLRHEGLPLTASRLLVVARERRAQALVIGLPLDADQRPTRQAERCRRLGLRLARSLAAAGLPLPLAWVNEHASTWSAAERHGLHGDRSGRLDSAAAAILLEQWLREGPEPEPVPAANDGSGGRGDAGSS
jgi:putative Holliday junction resolvase